MAVGRSRQGTNQEGALIPAHSPWDMALDGARGQLISQPLPIGARPDSFGGTVGGFFTMLASSEPLIEKPGFFGDVPQSQQGLVAASEPWERP